MEMARCRGFFDGAAFETEFLIFDEIKYKI
jgi:hypothetical protein